VRIALLKAEIVRTNLAFTDLSVLVVDSIYQKLDEWYERLPPKLRMSNAELGNVEVGIRRTIYHIHLLYLGAFIMLHRRLMPRIVQLRHLGRERLDMSLCPIEKVMVVMERGVLAAQHSARIINLLLTEDGVFKRCWLVM
jgi:hypothetical protein